jgi:hypothetical protein
VAPGVTVGAALGVAAGVGVGPASVDPAIEKNMTVRVQPNLMTNEAGEFREAIFAFMGWISKRGHRP